MSHFGSQKWPSSFGTVAYLNANTDAANYPASATTQGSTEGTDLLTYTVPTGETGLYLILSHLHTNVVSDAGTSQTMETSITYNDGAAQTTISLGEASGGGSATVAPVSTKTVDTHLSQRGVVRAEAGTDIAVKITVVSGGTVATSGNIDVNFAIVRVG